MTDESRKKKEPLITKQKSIIILMTGVSAITLGSFIKNELIQGIGLALIIPGAMLTSAYSKNIEEEEKWKKNTKKTQKQEE